MKIRMTYIIAMSAILDLKNKKLYKPLAKLQAQETNRKQEQTKGKTHN
jgi:hypothetical protein